jgi:hypothetical protein
MAIDADKMMNEKNWTQEKIDGLKQDAKRLHFDHFSGIQLIGGREWHVWSDGTLHRFKERKISPVRNAQAAKRRRRRDIQP